MNRACFFSSSCPPPALVKEVLSNVQRLTFYGFLMALSKHHGINQALGKPRSCGQPLLAPQYTALQELASGETGPRRKRHHHFCLDLSGPDSEGQGAGMCTTQACPLRPLTLPTRGPAPAGSSHSRAEGQRRAQPPCRIPSSALGSGLLVGQTQDYLLGLWRLYAKETSIPFVNGRGVSGKAFFPAGIKKSD